MRIMSLPDDFKFAPGSEEAMEERIGLMVAPKVMQAISSHLYNNVLKPYKELQQ
jgi:site-specific DNA-cytosine methylase